MSRATAAASSARVGSERRAAGIGEVAHLDRRARHRAVGAKDAAIAGLRPHDRSAARALVEIQARIGRHDFGLSFPAPGTGQGRFEDDAHIGVSYQNVRASSASPRPKAVELAHLATGREQAAPDAQACARRCCHMTRPAAERQATAA